MSYKSARIDFGFCFSFVLVFPVKACRTSSLKCNLGPATVCRLPITHLHRKLQLLMLASILHM